MFFVAKNTDLVIRRMKSKKLLPDLIYNEVIKEFNYKRLKPKLLGSGYFSSVFGCDFAIFKVWVYVLLCVFPNIMFTVFVLDSLEPVFCSEW